MVSPSDLGEQGALAELAEAFDDNRSCRACRRGSSDPLLAGRRQRSSRPGRRCGRRQADREVLASVVEHQRRSRRRWRVSASDGCRRLGDRVVPTANTQFTTRGEHRRARRRRPRTATRAPAASPDATGRDPVRIGRPIGAAARARLGGGGADVLEHGVGVGEPDEDRLVGARAPSPPPRPAWRGRRPRRRPRRCAGPPSKSIGGRDVAADHADQRADDRELGGEPGRRAGVAEQCGEVAGPGRAAPCRRRGRAARGRPARPPWPAGCRPACRRGTPARAATASPSRPGGRPTAPIGRPPPITLPNVVRSGVTSYLAWAPPASRRNPVITSSKISRAPTRSHSARSPSRNPAAGATTPMLAATGSTMTAATPSSSSGTCVVRHDERLGDGAGRDAGRAGQPERGHPAAAGGQQGVGGPVEVAVERDDAGRGR